MTLMDSTRPTLVVTFASTAQAYAMEAKSKEEGFPGRLASVPPAIDAECGLAWVAPLEARPDVEAALDTFGLECDGIYETEL